MTTAPAQLPVSDCVRHTQGAVCFHVSGGWFGGPSPRRAGLTELSPGNPLLHLPPCLSAPGGPGLQGSVGALGSGSGAGGEASQHAPPRPPGVVGERVGGYWTGLSVGRFQAWRALPDAQQQRGPPPQPLGSPLCPWAVPPDERPVPGDPCPLPPAASARSPGDLRVPGAHSSTKEGPGKMEPPKKGSWRGRWPHQYGARLSVSEPHGGLDMT